MNPGSNDRRTGAWRARIRAARTCRQALGIAAVALLTGAAAATSEPLPIGAFSKASPGGALPTGWKTLEFPEIARHTRYALVRDASGATVVEARAERSASGLIRALDLPAAQRPLLRWRWKAANLIVAGDVKRREGDDYPVRLYVSFRYTPERLSLADKLKYLAARALYGEYPPHAGLNYIWDAKAPPGTIVPNPYTDRVRMIVVESGSARLGQWLDFERDLVADYRLAFGEDPPPIAGIALMTDADNTGESALAWYGDISLSPRP